MMRPLPFVTVVILSHFIKFFCSNIFLHFLILSLCWMFDFFDLVMISWQICNSNFHLFFIQKWYEHISNCFYYLFIHHLLVLFSKCENSKSKFFCQHLNVLLICNQKNWKKSSHKKKLFPFDFHSFFDISLKEIVSLLCCGLKPLWFSI